MFLYLSISKDQTFILTGFHVCEGSLSPSVQGAELQLENSAPLLQLRVLY